MASNARPGIRILGSLRSADGKGVVRIEDRYDTDIDDLWSAVTDPGRLARWYGQVEGDLRPGGHHRLAACAFVVERVTGVSVFYDLGSTTLVTTQRCLPILRSQVNPSFS
jgi:hypothetical protein